MRRLLVIALFLGVLGCGLGESCRSAWADPNEDLLLAASSGDVSGVKAALRAGANVNARDNGGNTALIRAVMTGNTIVIPLLLKAGADVYVKNDFYHYSARDYASKSGSSEIISLLDHWTAFHSLNTNMSDSAKTPLVDSSMVKEFDKAKLEERKGHYRNAMNAYLSLWSSSHAFLPSNVQKDLLHHILSTRQHVHPLPPTPEAFRKEMVMGLADIRDAHNQNAYRRALSHFQNASQLVPWAPQPYEAIGHVEEALQNYPEAIEALKMLLEINPNGPSARSTRDHIYELEEKSKGY